LVHWPIVIGPAALIFLWLNGVIGLELARLCAIVAGLSLAFAAALLFFPVERCALSLSRRWRERLSGMTVKPVVAKRIPAEKSDIDPDGTWIFQTVERALERELTPHLMSVEIAERYGRSPVAPVRSSQGTTKSAISDLSVYLQRDDAKWLEQEELDPAVPVCNDGASGHDRKSA
jgi:hypothetical protein